MMGPGFDGGDIYDLYFTLENSLGVKFDDFPPEVESAEDIYRIIHSQVGSATATPANFLNCPTARAFHSFRSIVEKVDPAMAPKIVPTANIEELVPEQERPRFWRELNKTGLNLPPLRLPQRRAVLIEGVACLCILLQIITHAVLWPQTLWLNIFIVPVLVTVLLVSSNRVLWRWAWEIPKPLNKVRGMATYLAYRDCRPDWVSRLTRRQVDTVVTLAVALEFDQSLDEVRQRRLDSRSSA